MSASEAFQRFERSFTVTGPASMDSLDLGALAQLTGDERAAAQQRLLDMLAQRTEDPRVPPALATLGPATYDPLRRALQTYPPGPTKVALAQLLWQIERNTGAPSALIGALRTSGDGPTRIAAINTLSGMPGVAVDAALLAVLGDADAQVRTTALSTLMGRHGLGAHRRPPSPLSTAATRLGSTVGAVRREAALEVEGVVSGLAAGRTQAELGLDPAPVADEAALDQVRESLLAGPKGEWADAIDLQTLDGLPPAGRRWVEDLLLWRLGFDDPRVPEALVHLHSIRAVPALREVSTHAVGPFGEAVRRALDVLAR